MRATTTSELATPCASAGESASAALLTGASASPTPRPTRTSTTVVATASPSGLERPARHGEQPGAGQRETEARHRAVTEVAQGPAAEQRPDGHGEQEAHEHERRARRVVVLGESSEQRHVDDDRDERRPDEQADDESPHAPGVQHAARDERSVRPTVPPPEHAERHGADRQQRVAERTHDLALGVRGGEGQHEAAEGDRDEHGAEEVGPPQHRPPPRRRHRGEDHEQPEGDDARSASAPGSPRRTARRGPRVPHP